ncbi:MAG: hypothetical protein ACRDI2_02465 [Chloroflexota bacterium]
MMMFVAHPIAGVHRVPSEWMDGLWPSGFREATPAQVARWHEERGLEPPADTTPPSRPGAPSTAPPDGQPSAGVMTPPAHFPAAP